jgi:hypothetical protein
MQPCPGKINREIASISFVSPQVGTQLEVINISKDAMASLFAM